MSLVLVSANQAIVDAGLTTSISLSLVPHRTQRKLPLTCMTPSHLYPLITKRHDVDRRRIVDAALLDCQTRSDDLIRHIVARHGWTGDSVIFYFWMEYRRGIIYSDISKASSLATNFLNHLMCKLTNALHFEYGLEFQTSIGMPSLLLTRHLLLVAGCFTPEMIELGRPHGAS